MDNFLYLQGAAKERGIDLELLICGDGSDPCFEVFNNKLIDGTYWVEHENKPLGEKFNYALNASRILEWDYLFLNDTDDVFSGSIFDAYIKFINKGFDYISIANIYFMEYSSKQVVYWDGFLKAAGPGQSVGPGRLLKRELIERAGFSLWDNEINIKLNSSMNRTMQGLKAKEVSINIVEESVFVMDIKTDQNLWDFNNYKKVGVKKDARILLNKYLDKKQTDLILC